MTTSPQTATLLPMTVPFSESLSETWLLERTYHAHLWSGKELSVPDLTLAMKQLNDFDVPPSSQSSKSKVAERVPLKKNSNFSVPLSTWREVSQEEAYTTYQQGIPVLLFSEHAWEHPKGASRSWSANKHMRVIIYGNDWEQPEASSGTEYAVCYSDPKRGTFSNDAWRNWFSSDHSTILDGSISSTVTFLIPWMQFPSSTHYTVVASDEQVSEYADRTQAREAFQTMFPQEVGQGSDLHTVSPQFCYYHEVTCPGGVYRLEFFGPHMDEMGYRVKEAKDHMKGTA